MSGAAHSEFLAQPSPETALQQGRLAMGRGSRCQRKLGTDKEFAVASVEGAGIQGVCGLSWRGWQAGRGAPNDSRFTVSRTSKTGVVC